MEFLKRHLWYILGLVFVVSLLFFANYAPGTSLSGWDNMQTELFPSLAFKRAFFSVWEEYQSFGLLAGMAHGADLVRALWVGILGLMLPTSVVRYAFHFLMIFVGALGVFQLISSSMTSSQSRLYALLGSLFYILNYGIIQLIAVPWEAFSTHIAFFPWLIWSFLNYIRKGSRRALGWLAVVNLLATPQAYVQTIFVVYMLSIAVIALAHLKYLKRTIVAGLIIIALNAFWLLPQLYFVTTGGAETVQQAKINQLSSEDVLLENKSFGDLDSFARFTGFYTGIENGTKVPLFGPWIEHFTLPVKILQWFLFIIVLTGLFQKSRYKWSFIGLFGLSALALLTRTPGIEWVNDVVRQFPLIGEIFRSPFTKFVTLYATTSSYFFAVGAVKLFFPQSNTPILRIWMAPILAILLIYVALPAFSGHYISRDMRVIIPQDYHDTIEYFKTVDPNQRIALMPEYTFWGWYFTTWGYNGSGFLWYGIEQPIVSRTFDVWSSSSEAYFWEMKAALEAESVPAMERILEKYAIDYVIVDHSLRPVSSGPQALQYDRLAAMLEQSAKIHQFGFGKDLSLYKVKRVSDADTFVSLSGKLPSVGPNVTFPINDGVDAPLAYITSNEPEVYYPFRNLTSQTRVTDDQWVMQEFDEAFVFTARTPDDLQEYRLNAPSQVAPAELYIDQKPQTYTSTITSELNKKERTISVTVPKALMYHIEPGSASIYDCTRSTVKRSDNDTQVEYIGNTLRVASQKGATPCLGYDFPDLNQKYGYMLALKTRNIAGRRPFIALTDKTKDQAVLEDRIQSNVKHFIIPTRYEFGQGYTLTLQNTSYVGLPSINVVERIEMYLLPYNDLQNISFTKVDRSTQALSTAFSAPQKVHKRGYHVYVIDLTADEMLNNEYVVLHQSFHKGWKAFVVASDGISHWVPFLAGRALDETDHVRINDWEQGWKLPESCAKGQEGCRIVLVFWPQYLQWIGFGVLAGAMGFVLIRYIKK